MTVTRISLHLIDNEYVMILSHALLSAYQSRQRFHGQHRWEPADRHSTVNQLVNTRGFFFDDPTSSNSQSIIPSQRKRCYQLHRSYQIGVNSFIRVGNQSWWTSSRCAFSSSSLFTFVWCHATGYMTDEENVSFSLSVFISESTTNEQEEKKQVYVCFRKRKREREGDREKEEHWTRWALPNDIAGKYEALDDLITDSCAFDSILSLENDIGDGQLSLGPLDRNRQCVNMQGER